jgi:hypothetical protein
MPLSRGVRKWAVLSRWVWRSEERCETRERFSKEEKKTTHNNNIITEEKTE